MRRVREVVIVGAGPAGLMAAHGLRGADVLVVEKGAQLHRRTCPMTSACLGCRHCGEVEGVGGAGGWSDGKLCLAPVGIVDSLVGPRYAEEAAQVADILVGLAGDRLPAGPVDHVQRCFVCDRVTQEVTPVLHVGTSHVRLVVRRMVELLRRDGCELQTGDPVCGIADAAGGFRLELRSGREVLARNVVVATGAGDATLVPGLVRQYGLRTLPNEATVGFRLSLPNREVGALRAMGSNPKLRLQLAGGDAVKTHCFCYGGEVMAYVSGDGLLVGGRADNAALTPYANVNVLYEFTSRLRHGQAISREILRRIRSDHPDVVLHQDWRSFADGGPSPTEVGGQTCRGSRLAALAPYFPPDVLAALRRFVEETSRVYGIDLGQAKVFGPAAEWMSDLVCTSRSMETAKPGLYVVGDGAGATQGMVAAAVTARRAARAIRGG